MVQMFSTRWVQNEHAYTKYSFIPFNAVSLTSDNNAVLNLQSIYFLSPLHNDPSLDGKYLGTISADFVHTADKLLEASYLLRKKGDYAHPVFIVSKEPLAIGALLIEEGELGNRWYYYAAYADVLVQYKLIAADKLEAFKNTYKDPDEFCCLLVIDTAFANFLYIPYPVD